MMNMMTITRCLVTVAGCGVAFSVSSAVPDQVPGTQTQDPTLKPAQPSKPPPPGMVQGAGPAAAPASPGDGATISVSRFTFSGNDSISDAALAALVAPYLDAKHVFGIDETVGIVCNLLDALDYAHEKYIYHRDIKPANVMIDVRGRVKLTDFGVARQSDGTGNDGTRAGTMVGTPSYMSPEQIKGLPAQAAADLFATGVVLYQCLTLHKPFSGGSEWEIWQKIVNEPPPPLSQYRAGVPPALERAMLRALAKDPKERPPSAAAMIADLKASIAGASFDPDATRIVSKPATGPARDDSSMRPVTTQVTRTGSGTGSQHGNASGGFGVAAPAFNQQSNEIELEFWRSIKDSGDREEFQLFLERFPAGTYSDLARRKMSKLAGAVPADDTDASMARQIEEQEAKVRQLRADQERRLAEAERERELARQRVEEARLEQVRQAEEARRLQEEEEERLREEAAARARAEEEARLAELARQEALEKERIAAAQREAARVKAAEEEAARVRAAEEEVARVRAAKEAEAARRKAMEEEAARARVAEEAAARAKAAQEEKARALAAEAEAKRIAAAEEKARLAKAAEEEAARARAAEEAAVRDKAAQESAAREKARAEEAARVNVDEDATRIAVGGAALAGLPPESEAQRIECANERALLEASEEAARQLKRKKQADAERQAVEEREAAELRAASEQRASEEQREADAQRLKDEQWAAAEKRAAEKEAEAQRRREAQIAQAAPSDDEPTRLIRPADRAGKDKAAADADKQKAAAEQAAREQARQTTESEAAAERERHAIGSAIGHEVKEVGAARGMTPAPGRAPLFLGIGAAVLVLAGGAYMLTSKKDAPVEAKSAPSRPDRAVVVEPAVPPPSVPSGPARIVTPPQPAPAAAPAVTNAAPPPAPDLRAEKEAARRAEAQRLADLKAKEQKEQKELAGRKAAEDAKLAEENKAKEAAAAKVRDDAAKKDLAAKAKAKELADQKARDDAAAQHAKELAEQKAKDDEKARVAAAAAAAKAKARSDPDALFAQAQSAEKEGRSREAVDLYKQAYSAGNGRAARMLGDIYGKGSGDVGRDYGEQLQWYEKAKAAGVDVPTPGKRKY